MNPINVTLAHERQWVMNTKYLVFSGGGVRGLAYLGIVEVLRTLFANCGLCLFDELQGYAGASAGAVFSMLLCVGCRGPVLWEETMKSEMEQVVTDFQITDLVTKWGLNSKSRVNSRLKGILRRHAGDPNITFRQLADRSKKELVVAVCCVETGEIEHHSAATTPDYLVWKSVSASMSIPLVFAPEKIGARHYCDGGILDNCPIVFDIEKSLVFVLGRAKRSERPVNGFMSYFFRVMMMPMNAIQSQRLRAVDPRFKNRIVHVVLPKWFSSFDFNISEEKKRDIALVGARLFLNWLDPSVLEKQVANFILYCLTMFVKNSGAAGACGTTVEVKSADEDDSKPLHREQLSQPKPPEIKQ